MNDTMWVYRESMAPLHRAFNPEAPDFILVMPEGYKPSEWLNITVFRPTAPEVPENIVLRVDPARTTALRTPQSILDIARDTLITGDFFNPERMRAEVESRLVKKD